jgi:hypothetical protein
MMNFLVLLPAALLILAAVGIVLLRQFRPGVGYAWLAALGASVAAVAAILALRGQAPLQLVVEWWQPFAGYSTPPALLLDERSWPYAFSLAVLAVAFVLTDAARLESRQSAPADWAVGLVLVGLGLLAVMAGNPITLIVAWTAVDLAEFLIVIPSSARMRMAVQTVTLFGVRVTATLLVIVAILLARWQSTPFDLTPIPVSLALIMLLAAGLRLGVLPLNIPFTREVYGRRGLGNVMRMVGPASSLVVLGRMPENAVPPELQALFLAFSALAAVYGATMWFFASSEVNGRPYWFIALAALGIASVTNGRPLSSIAWGLALLLPGSLMFFYSARRRQFPYVPVLAVISLTGLPFTPAASGWLGVIHPAAPVYSALFLLAVVFLLWGYLRHLGHPRDELYRMERWVQTVYPVGLFFLILALWGAMVIGWQGSLSAGVWWASGLAVFLAALGAVLAFTFRYRFPDEAVFLFGSAAVRVQALTPVDDPLFQPVPGVTSEQHPLAAAVDTSSPPVQPWLNRFARRVGNALAAFFRLDWLYRFLLWVYGILQNIVQVLTLIFEGDGGILWSLVMLALLISLIWAGGAP